MLIDLITHDIARLNNPDITKAFYSLIVITRAKDANALNDKMERGQQSIHPNVLAIAHADRYYTTKQQASVSGLNLVMGGVLADYAM